MENYDRQVASDLRGFAGEVQRLRTWIKNWKAYDAKYPGHRLSSDGHTWETVRVRIKRLEEELCDLTGRRDD